MSLATIVEVKDLKVNFYTYAGVVEALDGVNVSLREGEILGLVGETGSGKSVTSLSVMMLARGEGTVSSTTAKAPASSKAWASLSSLVAASGVLPCTLYPPNWLID